MPSKAKCKTMVGPGKKYKSMSDCMSYGSKKRGKDPATQTSKVDIMRDNKRKGLIKGAMRGNKVKSRHATPRTLVGESLPFSEKSLNKRRSKIGYKP